MTLVLAGIAVFGLLELAFNLVVRPQEGPPALFAALETQLLAVGTVAGALVVLRTLSDTTRRGTWLTVIGLVALVAGLVRLGGEWWSPTPEDGVPSGALVVATWNLEQASKTPSEVVEALLDPPGSRAPQLVALQELTPSVARALEADPDIDRAYPYRILVPRTRDDGLGLLSSLPLVTGSDERTPVRLTAGLLLDDGTRVEVVATHPSPPRIDTIDLGPLRSVPVGLDTRFRDITLRVLHDEVAAAGDPRFVLVLGDLATTPFEPGFADVGAGLHDAHADAGVGTGFTWRPDELELFDAGVLRIDHVLSGEGLVPLLATEDCSLPGDHCRLTVSLRVVHEATDDGAEGADAEAGADGGAGS